MRRESDFDDEDGGGRIPSGSNASGSLHGKCGSLIEAERLFAEVDAKVDALVECTDSLDGAGAGALLGTATRITAILEALRLKLISRIDSSGIWQADESATAASWLREHEVLDHRSAKSDLESARLVSDYPQLSDAVSSGRLSRAHVDTIASVGLRTPARRAALADFLNVFIDIAESAPASVLRKVMRAWADQVDPLTTARDEHEAHSRRYLNVNLLADGVFLEGFFDHEQGAKIVAALNGALTKSRRSQLGDARGSEGGSGVAEGDHDPADATPVLSTSQQRADAFISEVIDPVLTSGGLPSTGGSRASVTVLVPLARLEHPCSSQSPAGGVTGLGGDAVTGLGGDRRGDVPQDAWSQARKFEFASPSISVNNGSGSALLSTEAAQRLTCDCEVHRLVISPEGLPLDVGRTMRTFPAHLRKALNVRDGGCVFPHCDRPPGWTEAHHIVHWAQGGVTSLQNSALLCSKHHHKVHAEGHTVEIGPDGRGRVLVRNSAYFGKRPREKLRL